MTSGAGQHWPTTAQIGRNPKLFGATACRRPRPDPARHVAHQNVDGEGHAGVAIGVRGKLYGDLHLSERRNGGPFDASDESTVIALAGAAVPSASTPPSPAATTPPLTAIPTLVFFTDGLIEHPAHAIDTSLRSLAELAANHAITPLDELVRTLADHHPGDGHDDLATPTQLPLPANHRRTGGGGGGPVGTPRACP
ncbi:hypothetical protein [Kitasatospora sp. NPDC056531]|uniref:hypothetical protein n=1 Tax=Kitasatospora sp. NPDC056531 TaxID=3345856 RepID=UPI0036C1B43B